MRGRAIQYRDFNGWGENAAIAAVGSAAAANNLTRGESDAAIQAIGSAVREICSASGVNYSALRENYSASGANSSAERVNLITV